MSSYSVWYVLAKIISTCVLYQLWRKSKAMSCSTTKILIKIYYWLWYLAPPSSITAISIVCPTSVSVMMTQVQYAHCKTIGWNANTHVCGILPYAHTICTRLFMNFITHVDVVWAMERQKWNGLYTLRWGFPWTQYVHSKHVISTSCHDNYIVMAIWLPWFCANCISIIWWGSSFW